MEALKSELDEFKSEEERVLLENMPRYTGFKEQPSVNSLFVPKWLESKGCLFFSSFECGNLKRAIRISDQEYKLMIEPDQNTKGHMHWFYFEVHTKLPAGTVLRLHMTNLLRADSLYS